MSDYYSDYILNVTDDAIRLAILAASPNSNIDQLNLAYDVFMQSIIMQYSRGTREPIRGVNPLIRLRRVTTQRATVAADPGQGNPLLGLCYLSKPKVKALKQSELDAPMTDRCGICLDVNTRANSIVTSCGHEFCKNCYDEFVGSVLGRNRQADRTIRCPICRTTAPKYTVFRVRKTPVRKPKAPVANQEVNELADLMTGIAI